MRFKPHTWLLAVAFLCAPMSGIECRAYLSSVSKIAFARMGFNRNMPTEVMHGPMSRSDAVVAGGFVFPDLNSSSRTTKDSDGITLKQRTDQLGRRVREAEKWIQHARETGELSGSYDK